MARETNRAGCPDPDKEPSVVALPGAARQRVRQGPLANTFVARTKLLAARARSEIDSQA
ncbi:hypothetical protein [Erythrobacter colymbi]|uniref:hypothetical protein n=1 Tax=Erythrobacter colymbi TaxID=1161202 RepID=UPI0012DDE438|nr:hypothetical protein [Erythrobacter colymbi]